MINQNLLGFCNSQSNMSCAAVVVLQRSVCIQCNIPKDVWFKQIRNKLGTRFKTKD